MAPTPLVFDEARYAALLSAGDREMFILKWLSMLDAYLETDATNDELKGIQERLELVLLEIIMIPPATHAKANRRLSWLGSGSNGPRSSTSTKPSILTQVPKPTRVIRDLVAKCLARLYEVGDMRTLGETLDAVQAVMQAKKKEVEREAKLASLVCAGVLFEALSAKAGFRLLSCFNDFLSIIVKIIKTSSETITVRVEATRALAKILQGGGKTASESQAKEILKVIRPNLLHKSPLLVLAMFSAFESLALFTPFILPAISAGSSVTPIINAESFVSTTLIELLQTRVLVVRRAAAHLIAILISNSITLSPVPAIGSAIAMDGELPYTGTESTFGMKSPVGSASKITDPAFRAIARSGSHYMSASANASVRNSTEEPQGDDSSIDKPASTTQSLSPSPVSGNSGGGRARRGTFSAAANPTTTRHSSTYGLQNIRSSNDLGQEYRQQIKSPMPTAGRIAPVSSSKPQTTSQTVSGTRVATLAQGLSWLSTPFVRASASRELRAGIVDAYAALFEELGGTVIEAHYPIILNHILVDLASAAQIPASSAIDTNTRATRPDLTHAIGTPSNLPTNAFYSSSTNVMSDNRNRNGAETGVVGSLDARAEADILALRNMCAWLLRVPIAQKLLTEQGKISAAQSIWNIWLAGSLSTELRNAIENSARESNNGIGGALGDAAISLTSVLLNWTPNSAHGPRGSGSDVGLLVALQEWRALAEDLGEACASLSIFSPIPISNDAGQDDADYYSDVSRNIWTVPFESWLGHPNEAVRLGSAACMGSLLLHNGWQHMSRVIATLVSRFQQLCAHCSTHTNPTLDAMRRCIGYAQAISSVISMCGASTKGANSLHSNTLGVHTASCTESMLGVPLDLVEWVHSIANLLLSAAYQRTDPDIVDPEKGNLGTRERIVAGASSADPADIASGLGTGLVKDRVVRYRKQPAHSDDKTVALQNMRMNTGWTLLTGLTSLGFDFVISHAYFDWAKLWASAMPQPDSVGTSGFVTADMPWHMRAHQLQSRYMALTHLLAWLRIVNTSTDPKARCLLTPSVTKRLLTCLRFTLMFADNALDAPPPPTQNTGGNGDKRRPSVSIRTYDIVDPARPITQLPVPTSILITHVQIRDRIIECLQTFTQPKIMKSLTPVITRLVETTIASTDNILEIYGTRIGSAILSVSQQPRRFTTQIQQQQESLARSNSMSASFGRGDSISRPGNDESSEDYVCLRGFRSGPWGYEAESGTTSLLCRVVSSRARDSSGDQQLSGDMAMASGMDFGTDFAGCHMFSFEFDWLAILCPVPSMSIKMQPIPVADSALNKNMQSDSLSTYSPPTPSPYTKLIDNSIQLFGLIFPSLSENAQLTILDDLVFKLNKLPFNSHRYMAVLTNILLALYSAMQGYSLVRQGVVLLESDPQTSPSQQHSEVPPRVARAVVEMTRAALILPSPEHRLLAGEVIGHLATFTRDAATSYLPYLLDHLTSQAIRSRDRFARAGTAVALGSLYSRAGSIVAGAHLKQVVVLLHSLASDKDPIVHNWAISALAEAALSAGFMFEPYARDTFMMALKLFLNDSHSFPLYASSFWIRGKEHAAYTEMDCASYERVTPLRSLIDHNAWHRQAASQLAAAAAAGNGTGHMTLNSGTLGNIVAVGNDAAITHPNSTTHHGRGSDEQRDAAQYAAVGGDGDYQYVCAKADLDSYDVRAPLGHLVSSLILVFGPELQVDDDTRDLVLTLLRELHRSLSSVGVVIPTLSSGIGNQISPIHDPDARWQTAAEFIFASQKQLLFFPPRNQDFLPRLVRQTLRPILQSRHIAYYGYSSEGGASSFHHVAVLALDSILRLYGERIFEALVENPDACWADWAIDDIVWEALALHNVVSDQDATASLLADLRKLVGTAMNLVVGIEYPKFKSPTELPCDNNESDASIEIDRIKSQIPETASLTETLCNVFTSRFGSVITLGPRIRKSTSAPLDTAIGAATVVQSKQPHQQMSEDALLDNVRQFNNSTKQMAIASIIGILDSIERARPSRNRICTTFQSYKLAPKWRAHPLTSQLPDLVRVGYMAATTPSKQSLTLACLGLYLLKRIIEQFCDVEDPAMPGEGMRILSIYQAQLTSAFMPALSETQDSLGSSVIIDDAVGLRSASSSSSPFTPTNPALKQSAMRTATAYLTSGLVSDRNSLLRILRFIAPQIAFKSLALGTPGAKHKFDTDRDPLDSTTHQMHIITRLATLRTWSDILEYALVSNSAYLLDALSVHIPLLCKLWLDAVRDTVVITVNPGDVQDELHMLSQVTGQLFSNSMDRTSHKVGEGLPDIGLGLNLGLESSYLTLVRNSLYTWYRYNLPHFLRALASILSPPSSHNYTRVDKFLAAGRSELMLCLQNSPPVRMSAALDVGNGMCKPPTQMSVLIIGFIMQELNLLSQVTKFPRIVVDKIIDSERNPYIGSMLSTLLDSLSIGGRSGRSTENDNEESQRIEMLSSIGVHIWGPTLSGSTAAMKWHADITRLLSLLDALYALLNSDNQLDIGSFLFAISNNKNNGDDPIPVPWLLEDLWEYAVRRVLLPITDSDLQDNDDDALLLCVDELNDMTKQQYNNRNVVIDVATRSLCVAKAIISCISACDRSNTKQSTIFNPVDIDAQNTVHTDRSEGDVGSLDMLGLSSLGESIVQDIVDVWKFTCVFLNHSSNADQSLIRKCGQLASAALQALTEVVISSFVHCNNTYQEPCKSLFALWLNMWYASVFKLGVHDPASFKCLDTFVSQLYSSTVGSNDNLIDSERDIVDKLVSGFFLELLELPRDDGLHISLSLVARFIARTTDSQTCFIIPQYINDLFVTKLISFATENKSSSDMDTAMDIMRLFAADENYYRFAANPALANVLPQLAKGLIPPTVEFINSHSSENDTNKQLVPVTEKALSVVSMFGTASYSDPTIDSAVMASILMSLLSMLPDTPNNDGGDSNILSAKITESILTLASVSPGVFKPIVLKLSNSYPTAKTRLEAAIRSRAIGSQRSHKNDGMSDANDDNAHHTETAKNSTKISLKNSFSGF